MRKCGDCVHYVICRDYVSPAEMFPEVDGGCGAFMAKNGWISVEDRLPEQNGEYLIYTSRGFIMMSYCFANSNGFERWDVTHWMPLPKTPKRE